MDFVCSLQILFFCHFRGIKQKRTNFEVISIICFHAPIVLSSINLFKTSIKFDQLLTQLVNECFKIKYNVSTCSAIATAFPQSFSQKTYSIYLT